MEERKRTHTWRRPGFSPTDVRDLILILLLIDLMKGYFLAYKVIVSPW